jgi:hypothetical protein
MKAMKVALSRSMMALVCCKEGRNRCLESIGLSVIPFNSCFLSRCESVISHIFDVTKGASDVVLRCRPRGSRHVLEIRVLRFLSTTH